MIKGSRKTADAFRIPISPLKCLSAAFRDARLDTLLCEKFNQVVRQPVSMPKLGTSITHLYVINNKNFTVKYNKETFFNTIIRVINYFSKQFNAIGSSLPPMSVYCIKTTFLNPSKFLLSVQSGASEPLHTAKKTTAFMII